MAKVIRFRDLLHLGTGIGNGNKLTPGLLCAHRLLRALEKILLEDVWFERAPTLTGNDEQRFRDVDLILKRPDLGGIGGVEHVQFGEAGNGAESHPQDFGTKTRSPHAEQKSVPEPGVLRIFCDLVQLFALGNLLSIYSPKKLDWGTFGRQRASRTTVLASFGIQFGIVGLGTIVFLLARHYGSFWLATPVFLALSVLSFTGYALVLERIDRMALDRRETLISELCRA